MIPITRRRYSVGPMALGGFVLSAAVALAADSPSPSLTEQLNDLGRQAVDQGRLGEAADFYKKSLSIDPSNAEARRALRGGGITRVAMQDPADGPATNAPAKPSEATLEGAADLERARQQQMTSDVSNRMLDARTALKLGDTAQAKDILRLTRSVINAEQSLSTSAKRALLNQVDTQYLSTINQEERIDDERADRLRREAGEVQRNRSLNALQARHATVDSIMRQFDNLMLEGRFRVLSLGGTGNIALTTLPFVEAREMARQARGLEPNAMAPRVGMYVAASTGYLTQSLAYEELKENRFMATLQDVERAAVPFPDTITYEYPPITAELLRRWERRSERFGRPVSLVTRDEPTRKVYQKLEEPITIQYPSETPLDEVLKYIKSATSEANYAGIQYYLDPVGLQEADRTETSPVKIDLENIPLKTALKLILDQVGLVYTVKDGILKIDNKDSENLATEIRVYPVADLAMIPLSLMGGGGGGGMGGGGMGGGGMGGGGMGGGGMGGGGMGGGGMGGMGGMMSMPVQDPASSYAEKKSN